MSWFDEQLKQRKQRDQDVFDDSLYKLAGAVTGQRSFGGHKDESIITKDAIDDILRYYHYKPAQIPDSIKDPAQQLSYAMRPHGLMYRRVELEEGWEKDAFGCMIAYLKEDGTPVAVYPKTFTGYWYRDANGKKQSINSRTEKLFEREALCFYRPMPMRKIGIPDLLIYIKNCLGVSDLIVLVAMTLAVTLVGLITPHLSKILTGFVLDSGRYALLWGTAVFLICVKLSSQVLAACRELAMTRVNTKVNISVDSAMMVRIMNLPAPFFRDYNSGELSSRNQAVSRLCGLLISSLLSTGLTSLSSLLYITQIFQFAPALVVPSLLVIGATLFLMIMTTLAQLRLTRMSMELGAKETGLSFALISGVRKIRLAGAEKRAFAKWAQLYSKTAAITYNPPLFLKINSTLNTALSLAGMGVIYYLSVKSGVTYDNYIAFNASYAVVMGAFMSLAGIATSLAQIRPTLEMAEPILKAEPENKENREIVTKVSGSIELSNVYFRYTEGMPYVVDGMSLKIKSGEYVAIVGRTGCGKSTLVRLLLGFEVPERGAIYYDGKDINRLDLQSLRRSIGVVTQDGGLFQGDIYSNIVISAPHLTLDDAWAAAEIAGIADDIRAMPMGMHTIIGEGMGGVSGGQKQRLMIARAVAPKPKILIFDEATSALDNKTQRQVSEALDALKCTRIVIAHRLSTIKHCDRILVLDGGHIIEDGTYDQLLEKHGYFYELVERQRLDVDTDEEDSKEGDLKVDDSLPGADDKKETGNAFGSADGQAAGSVPGQTEDAGKIKTGQEVPGPDAQAPTQPQDPAGNPGAPGPGGGAVG